MRASQVATGDPIAKVYLAETCALSLHDTTSDLWWNRDDPVSVDLIALTLKLIMIAGRPPSNIRRYGTESSDRH